jgi:hypothetical protein
LNYVVRDGVQSFSITKEMNRRRERTKKNKKKDGTYVNGCSLNEEADEVETQLAM